jgi:hypothetical protein
MLYFWFGVFGHHQDGMLKRMGNRFFMLNGNFLVIRGEAKHLVI